MPLTARHVGASHWPDCASGSYLGPVHRAHRDCGQPCARTTESRRNSGAHHCQLELPLAGGPPLTPGKGERG
eukprot:9332149-Prorocentrum_lima.AAC.1